MANQITIDIVAETKKLTSGINDANGQIDTMSTKLKGIAGVAGVAASGFLATQGLTFLKQGIDEAKEAQEVMRAATTTFGEGSAALEKITADADKFGKALSVDNDELIALATQLGSRLPAEIQSSSVELVKIFKDVEAFTAGAVTAEGAGNKLAKAFADGKLKAGELSKIFPGLEQATYDQAEALSKAGKNQDALNLLVDAGSVKYDDAAAKNVTSTQKFEVALAKFKEELGSKVLPILEKGIDFLTKLFEAFDNLPGPVQNVVIALGALLITGALTLTFLASMKASMVTLGITSGTTAGGISLATVATNLLNLALKALPILAIIALIVLLVQNWDTVTKVVGEVWEAIKNFSKDAWEAIKKFGSRVSEFVDDVIADFKALPGAMLSVGRDIVSGIWKGMQSMAGWLKDRVFDFFGNLIPGWAKKVLGIGSPSKVFARYGRFIVEGLAVGIERSADIARAATEGLGLETIGAFGNAGVPQLSTGQGRQLAPLTVNINAGLGTDPYELGRVVNSALKKYSSISARVE